MTFKGVLKGKLILVTGVVIMLLFAVVFNNASPVSLYVVTIASPVFVFLNRLSVFATCKADPALYNFDSLCPPYAC